MTMQLTKKQFESKQINKPDFISEMHRHHQLLFQYMDLLRDVDIQSIEITPTGILMTMKKSGIKIIVDRDDKRIVPIEALNFGDYEAEELTIVTTIVQNTMRPGYMILDIGANIGYYSMWLSKHFRNATIHAFEPIPKTFNYLERNLEINHTSGVTAHNFGLSDKDATFDFFYYKNGSGNASMANLSESEDAERVSCTVYTLDGFISQSGIAKIDFIKCDVEGAELMVVKGGLETLKRDRPVIFMEILRKWSAKFNYHPNDIINLLAEIGFHCYIILNGKIERFQLVDEQTVATNYFFVHKTLVYGALAALIHDVA